MDEIDDQPRNIQSVERAMAILECIAALGDAGVSEIGTKLGLHVATTHNLLRTLAAHHYLTNDSGRYRLGPAMAVLASHWNPVMALPSEVQPSLERISRETGEAASATVLVGGGARLIAFQPGTQAITIQFPQWVWPEAARLATGRLLLAHEPEARWDGLIRTNAQVEAAWSPETWRNELRALRDGGVCCTRHAHDSGQTAIACPIRAAGGGVIAAIGASAPTFRADPAHVQTMLRAVHAEAVAISRRLGHKGECPLPSIA